jgi:hypothetical protein
MEKSGIIPHLKELAKNCGIEVSKKCKMPFPTNKLAESVGRETEYAAFFKLYSKYVHPTAWSILWADNNGELNPFRPLFLTDAQKYALAVIETISDHFQITFPSEIIIVRLEANR